MPDLSVRVGGHARSLIQTFTTGWVAWEAGSDHHTMISYEVRVRAFGSGTVVASLNVGKPIPHSTTGLCFADINSILTGLSSGFYTTSVAATNASGTTDSDVSSVFFI
jgi:hypothetical protein